MNNLVVGAGVNNLSHYYKLSSTDAIGYNRKQQFADDIMCKYCQLASYYHQNIQELPPHPILGTDLLHGMGKQFGMG